MISNIDSNIFIRNLSDKKTIQYFDIILKSLSSKIEKLKVYINICNVMQLWDMNKITLTTKG